MVDKLSFCGAMRFFCALVVLQLFLASCRMSAGHDIGVNGQKVLEGDILPARIAVYESEIIKKVDRALLGYNHEWLGSERVVMGENLDISEGYLDVFQGYPMPLNRMSGTVSQSLKWKHAIGSLEERKEQKLRHWDKLSKKRLGPVEWVKSVLLVDPAAKFTWTLNMTDTPEDHADLAEFFTGDGENNPNGGVNWAKRRIDLGIKEPVNIAIWELGNELDWREGRKFFQTVDVYIEACQKAIAAIKKVQPDAKFAAHAATAAHETAYHLIYGGWEAWHREVLKHLGLQIDYIVFHSYYNGISQARQESYMDVISADIVKITGSDRIKLYISEHARWPGHFDKSRPWREYWYKTHALSGVLATGEWLNRMLARKDVAAAAYHAFAGGPWGLIYKDGNSGQLYTTGIADLFKVLNEVYGENVVSVETSGKFTDVEKSDCALTAAAMTTKEGLNLVLVNRDPMAKRNISFEFDGRYRLLKETVLTAENLDSHNTVDKKEIAVTSGDIGGEENFNSYIMPAKSMTVLYLKKI